MTEQPINPDELAKKTLAKAAGRFSGVWNRLLFWMPIIDTWPKKIIFWSLLIVVTFCISYTSAWYWNTGVIRSKYIYWVNSFVREGYPFDYKSVRIAGFFKHPAVEVIKPTFSGNFIDTSWTSSADKLTLAFDPWKPSKLRIKLENFRLHSYIVDAKQRDGYISIPLLTGSLIKKNDRWRLIIEAPDVKATSLGYLEPFQLSTFYVSIDNISPKGDYWADIVLSMKGQALNHADDQEPNTIEFVSHGHIASAINAGHFDRTIKEWRDNHGKIDFDDLYLRWGPFSLKSDIDGASFSLNSRMQLQSIFQADVVNYQHLTRFFNYLQKNEFMDEQQTALSTNQIFIAGKNVANMKIFILDNKVAFDTVTLFPTPTLARKKIVE